jgi:hypothetical protein
MRTTCVIWAKATAILALLVILANCTRNSPHVPNAEYSTTIVGTWLGTVGNISESMVINGDGTFVCHLQKTGFIADMLYPAAPGIVTGTWSIVGSVMTLTISGAKNERVANGVASSMIVAFSQNEIVLKSRRNTSSFRRTAGP